MRASLGVLPVVVVAASLAGAATFQEDFASEPAAHGWLAFGNTNLFQWNATNEDLEVTWDSSQTNSYFHHALGTVLAKSDDFSFEFDLRLSDIVVGVNPQQPFTFELAVSLFNLRSATNINWERGTGVNTLHGARNIVEFDYFPDSGYGATISPTLVSSNNQFGTGFNFPLELDAGALFHIAMSYTAGSQTLATTITREGQPFGAIQDVVLAAGFMDFRLDHFALCSYSDAGADGSILAHGVVDNIVVTTPPPPLDCITGGFSNAVWQVQFLSVSNWLYTLERSADFQSWTAVSASVSGNGTNQVLSERSASLGSAFYRVRAERP